MVTPSEPGYDMPIAGRDEWVAAARRLGMRDGYLRGTLSRAAPRHQVDVLAACVTAGGSVSRAAQWASGRAL